MNDIEINCDVMPSGRLIITQTGPIVGTDPACIVQEILDTKEAVIIKGLITLGWTPPPIGFIPRANNKEPFN